MKGVPSVEAQAVRKEGRAWEMYRCVCMKDKERYYRHTNNSIYLRFKTYIEVKHTTAFVNKCRRGELTYTALGFLHSHQEVKLTQERKTS